MNYRQRKPSQWKHSIQLKYPLNRHLEWSLHEAAELESHKKTEIYKKEKIEMKT